MPPIPSVSRWSAEGRISSGSQIRHRAGLIASHLDGVHHEIRILQGRLPVLHAQIGGDLCTSLVHIVVDGPKNDLRLLQTLRVNVIQRDLRIPKHRRAHAVPQHISRKQPCFPLPEKQFLPWFSPPFSVSVLHLLFDSIRMALMVLILVISGFMFYIFCCI